MRNKENLFTIQDMCDKYNELYEDKVSLKIYHDILRDFNIWLREFTFNANIFKMPHGTGTLYIQQSKPTDEFNEEGKLVKTTRRVDWVKTKELWKKYPHFQEQKKFVYYENNHTNGRQMRIAWKKGKINHVSIHYFKPCRTYQRNLSKIIFNNPSIEYYGW